VCYRDLGWGVDLGRGASTVQTETGNAAIRAGKRTDMKNEKRTGGPQSVIKETSSAEVREIRLVYIVVPRRRARRLRDVTPLVESIAQSGLIEPIIVRRLQDGRLVLVAGLHRLEAHRKLHRETILARIINVSDLEAELIELDENLTRTELTVLERGEHLLRRKQIYEQLHPETKQGGAPGKKGGGKKANDATVASFAEDTSAKTGLSTRTIQDDVKIARLGDDTKKAIRGTPWEDQKRVLLQITRVQPEMQIAVAKALASGRCRTVQQAAIELGLKDKPQPRCQRGRITVRVHGVLDPLREAKKRLERLAAGLDPVSAPEAKLIAEEIAATEEKIHAFARSIEARLAASSIPNDMRPKSEGWPVPASDDRSHLVLESTPPTGDASEVPQIMLLSEQGFKDAIAILRGQEQVAKRALDALSLMPDDDQRVASTRTRLQEMVAKSFEQLNQHRALLEGRYRYADYLRDHGIDPSVPQGNEGMRSGNRSSMRARYSLREVTERYWRRRSAQLQRTGSSASASPQPEVRPAQTIVPNAPCAAQRVVPHATALNAVPASERARAPMTNPVNVRNEVCNLLSAYLHRMLQTPDDVEAAIRAKPWPAEMIEAGLEIARSMLLPRGPSTAVTVQGASQASTPAQPVMSMSNDPSRPNVCSMKEAMALASAGPGTLARAVSLALKHGYGQRTTVSS